MRMSLQSVRAFLNEQGKLVVTSALIATASTMVFVTAPTWMAFVDRL